MPSTHPLELVEILSLVVAFLPLRSLLACARVSRVWYQACIPCIWNYLELNDPSKLKIGCIPQEYVALRFVNLDSLELHAPDTRTIQFIMEHPTVTTLELRDLSQDCQPAFWDALLGFRNLRSLV